MSKTLANLRFGVRQYLDEANQADFLDTEVDRSINYAMHGVIGEVVDVYEEFYNSTSPIQLSTVANQQEYAIGNTNLVKISRVEINYTPADPNATAQRATAIKTDELPLAQSANPLGSTGLFSAGYYVAGQVGSQIIGFTPIPTTVGTNNISIWGVVTPTDLSAATDTLSLPYADNYGQLVELKATAILLHKGQQAENYAAKYEERYDAGIQKMKQFLKDRQSDGVWLIGDALYEDTLFDMPL